MRSLGSGLPIDIQPRDVELLRGLFESRVMTLSHIAMIYFEGRKEAAKKRTQKLKAAGFIQERPRRPYEPAVLSVTRKGFGVLHEAGVLISYSRSIPPIRRLGLSDLMIPHELDVVSVKSAFQSASRRFDGVISSEFSTLPQICQFEVPPGFQRPQTTIKPDGFIRVQIKGADGSNRSRAFFLEVDRSTEVREILVAKARAYLDYYKTGGFALRNKAKREDYRKFPFRVLMVFKTPERRDNVAVRLLQSNPPIHSQIWLSTFDEVMANPFGEIWVCPADYQPPHERTNYPRDGFNSASWQADPGRNVLISPKRTILKGRIRNTDDE